MVKEARSLNEAITDDEAIARIRSGDIASYEILATRHQRRLHAVARQFLDSEADVEDAVQGAHLLALTHLHQYAGRSSGSLLKPRFGFEASRYGSMNSDV